jgi:hypothetical protein
MEAKDTVMDFKQFKEVYSGKEWKPVVEIQAEISFKAGMLGVADWMKENITWDWPNDELLFSSWLKERGL